ncbi:O-antigen ligase family protein [Aestuariispira insulae]|nr:O-antigen ligase family protein [Aestuariispira insulae]
MNLPTVSARLSSLQAAFLGISIPFFVIGRSVMAVAIALSALILLYRFVQERGWQHWRSLVVSPHGLVLSAMLLWWLISSVVAYDPKNALGALAHSAGYIFLAAEVARQFASRQEMIGIFMRSLTVSALVIGGYIVAVAYVNPDFLGLLEALRGKELSFIRVFKPYASLVACTMPLLFWWGLRDRGAWRWLSLTTLPVAVLVIYYNGVEISRAAVIGALVGFVGPAACWLLVKLPGILQRTIVVAGFSAVSIGGLLFLQALPHMPFDGMRLPEIALPFPDLHRQVIWGFIYDLVVANPLLGVGIDCSNLLPSARAEITLNLVKKVETVQFIGSHPHNWVLEVLVETGVPGLVGAVAALVLLTRGILYDPRLGQARWAAVGVIFAFWISSLANFSIWTSWWQAGFAVLIGVALASRVPEKAGG